MTYSWKKMSMHIVGELTPLGPWCHDIVDVKTTYFLVYNPSVYEKSLL